MNGFIKRAVALACLGASLAALGGCKLYDAFVDPCYPERYIAQSRASVEQAFAAQSFNGHVLDQTIWNYFFTPGTATLTDGGRFYLDHLARARPQPDPKVFLQTAQDVVYDAGAPDKSVNARRDLNEKRVLALQKYLSAVTADRPVPWEIAIHDPAPKTDSAIRMDISIIRHYRNAQGLLPAQGVGPGMAPGGPTGPSPR